MLAQCKHQLRVDQCVYSIGGCSDDAATPRHPVDNHGRSSLSLSTPLASRSSAAIACFPLLSLVADATKSKRTQRPSGAAACTRHSDPFRPDSRPRSPLPVGPQPTAIALASILHQPSIHLAVILHIDFGVRTCFCANDNNRRCLCTVVAARRAAAVDECVHLWLLNRWSSSLSNIIIGGAGADKVVADAAACHAFSPI